MVPFDTPVILDTSLWESPWPENRTIQAGYWLAWLPLWFEMVICTQRRLTAEPNVININASPCLQMDQSVLRGKKVEWGRIKVMVDHKSLSDGREMSFDYWQGPYIDNDKDVHQLLCKTMVALVGRFHSLGGQWMLWFGGKQRFPELVLTCHQLDPWEHTSPFNKKCTRKCRQQNGDPF